MEVVKGTAPPSPCGVSGKTSASKVLKNLSYNMLSYRILVFGLHRASQFCRFHLGKIRTVISAGIFCMRSSPCPVGISGARTSGCSKLFHSS